MRLIELVQALRGARKVACTQLLQEHCGLGLAQAKTITDGLLDGCYPTVEMPSDDAARSLIISLAQIGVTARFAEGDDYQPQWQLTRLLDLVRPILSEAQMRTCESLSIHGEWEIALSNCMAVLESISDKVPSEAQGLMEQLVIEFGLTRCTP